MDIIFWSINKVQNLQQMLIGRLQVRREQSWQRMEEFNVLSDKFCQIKAAGNNSKVHQILAGLYQYLSDLVNTDNFAKPLLSPILAKSMTSQPYSLWKIKHIRITTLPSLAARAQITLDVNLCEIRCLVWIFAGIKTICFIPYRLYGLSHCHDPRWYIRLFVNIGAKVAQTSTTHPFIHSTSQLYQGEKNNISFTSFSPEIIYLMCNIHLLHKQGLYAPNLRLHTL